MKKTLIALALLAASPAAAEPLRIATEGAFPPFSEINANGEVVGFDIDIAKALCAKMERECEIIAMDWDGIIPGLVNDKYDAIVASMSITEERKQTVDFTNPYYSNYLVLLAKKGSGLTVDGIAQQAVGAQRASISSSWAEEQVGARGDLRLYDTLTASFTDLEAGRIDSIVSDYFPALDWLKDHPDFEVVGDRIDIGDQIGIAVRKDDAELRDALNVALEGIVADGTYSQISTGYFGTDIH
ncbi:transporter substrate-binding domain-containing protein [Sedimentimonas flavescens]|uniref:Transporter substrate-binding domain-containing protein n=1 Tax=Sedimentimonas flavescens TaxID=2851012 RepID=A0ABT2ZVR4_9RHOB|nr:transporter substrate-binding domain-containing protein [Sedimentimonas flavescens]MCT2538813.1 transporter substrate-binding domain-containing protein [Sedimentimonas flavescens]MCV2877825.1 transporter substrate-binding domain-containing protein [Sedimentimonas flavescens]